MSQRTSLIALAAIALATIIAGCSESNPADPGTTKRIPDNPTNPASVSVLYDQLPDIAACNEGTLKAAEKMKVLAHVNAMRALHDLAPVEYRSDEDINTAKAALLIVANNMLTHQPTASMTCYTQQGYVGSEKGNLAYRTGPPMASEWYVEGWLIDPNVATLGHRRWILDPYLKYISFGRVDRNVGFGTGGAVLRVSFDEQRDITGGAPEIVAYPYHDYPARMLPTGEQMSLSVISNRANKWSNKNVDFSQATITVTSETGETLTASDRRFDTDGYGLPNNLRWRTGATVAGRRYDVTVANVLVEGAAKEYTWWFKLVQ